MINGVSHLREFGRFRLDAEKRVLWHGSEPVNLALKEIELLSVLTESAGEVVTKAELLDKVWQDSFVEESNLSRHIYVLRKMFKDLGEGEDLIKTVPRRGYRFAGDVHEIPKGEIVLERHTRTRTLVEFQDAAPTAEPAVVQISRGKSLSFVAAPLFALLIVALGVFAGYWFLRAGNPGRQPIKSIAVLPFRTINVDEKDSQQGAGLADVLTTRLSNIKDITVRPASTVLAFANEDPVAAGNKLKADAVLEGTIYQAGGKARVTSRLVRTSDGSIVWTGEFERAARDEMNLQNEIALRLVDALALNLTGAEKNAVAKPYTANADALDLYLKGRFEWNKRSWPGMIEAQRLFRNAIDKDPEFALAYVGLADTIGTSTQPTEAFTAVKKALELDPNLGEAYASLGFLQMFHERKWAEAEASFKKSIELKPGYATAHHWYATLLAIQGRNDEAKAEMLKALDINPVSYNFLADLGQIYYFAGDYDEAKAYCLKALEIYPDFQFAHDYLGDIYLKTGEYAKAVEEDILALRANSSFANAPAVEKERLEKNFSQMRELFEKGGINAYMRSRASGSPTAYYEKAMEFSFTGDNARALDNLEKALENRTFMLAFVKADPVFEPLRAEPRFRSILARMNLSP